MISLKIDFNERIGGDLNNNIFSNFTNNDYRVKEVTNYYFYIISYLASAILNDYFQLSSKILN